MNLRSQRDVANWQGVTWQDVCVRTAHHGLADFQACRGDDVTLFAIQVSHERDVRRAVRIVLDLRDATGNARLVALEINDPVKTLMAAAATTHSDAPVVIA